MATRRRIAITIEKKRRIALQRQSRLIRSWCIRCDEEKEMLSPEEAVVISGKSLRELFRLIEDSLLHTVETPDGLLKICFASLSKLGEQDLR